MWGENCVTSANVCVNITPLSFSLSALQEAMQIGQRVSGGVFRKYIFLSINIWRKPNLGGKKHICDGSFNNRRRIHVRSTRLVKAGLYRADQRHDESMIVRMCSRILLQHPRGWRRLEPVGQEAAYGLKSDGCRHKKAPQVLCAAAGKKVLCSWISTHCRGWQVCYVVWNKWFWIQQWWHTLPSVYLLADLK